MLKRQTNNTMVSIYEPMELPKEDPESVAIELDVVAHAKRRARDNAPDSKSTSPDHVELKLNAEVKAKATQAISSVHQSISSLRDEINTLSLSKESKDVTEMVQEMKTHAETRFSPFVKELVELKKQKDIASDELDDFKREHGLRRSADYPDSNLLTVSVLIIAIVIESIINGTFFAAGSDAGLVGGIMEACVISIINVGLGALLSWGVLRYKNYHINWKSTMALIFFAISVCVPFLFNLLIAHYREALIVDPDSAHILAINSFLEGILSIDDVNSWLLFLLGGIFFTLAAYKGYGLDDSYPGYGRVSRRKLAADTELEECHQAALEELEEFHSSYLDKLNESYQVLVRNEQKVANLSSAFDQHKRILDAYLSHMIDLHEYLVKLYRDTNQAEREEDAPSYFNSPVHLDLPNQDLGILYTDKRELVIEQKEELSQLLPTIRQDFLEIKKSVQSRLHEAL